jgi:hypothetical protein
MIFSYVVLNKGGLEIVNDFGFCLLSQTSIPAVVRRPLGKW